MTLTKYFYSLQLSSKIILKNQSNGLVFKRKKLCMPLVLQFNKFFPKLKLSQCPKLKLVNMPHYLVHIFR